MLIHPQSLKKETLLAIDQFLLKGGKILLFVDPHAIVDRSVTPMMVAQGHKNSSYLKPLMKHWGIELEVNKLAGDKYLAGFGRINPTLPSSRLLPIMNCDQRCTEYQKDPITTGLNNLTLIFPGSLKKIHPSKNTGFKIIPILTTTKKANTYNSNPNMLSQPELLINNFKEGNRALVLGYKIIGSFTTAFPEEIKNKKQKTIGDSLLLTKSKKETSVIIYSDVDFMHNEFSFKKSLFGLAVANQNSDLVLNSLESLSGSSELMKIRVKGKFNRSFDIIDKIEFEAQKGTKSKIQEINLSISKFQSELNKLGQKANNENLSLIQREGLLKKKKLSKKIAHLKSELREVKRDGREHIENIGKYLQYANTLLIPILLILFGLYYQNRQYKHRKEE